MKMACYASRVIDIALAEDGYLEKKSNKDLDSKTANAGSANYTKYGRDMHNLYPSVMNFPAYWCDTFVDWCFQKAYGVSNAKKLLCGDFDDYTVNSANLYKKKNAWGTVPKLGAQIFFKNSTRICHTGLVYKFDDKYVYTVEGNTSGASDVVPNGGGVHKKKYLRSNSRIAGYGYPKYDEAPAKTTNVQVTDNVKKASDTKMPTIKKGSKGKAVMIWQIIVGAKPDGDFGSDTLNKTKAFQKNHILEVDGVVGRKTWKAGLESV